MFSFWDRHRTDGPTNARFLFDAKARKLYLSHKKHLAQPDKTWILGIARFGLIPLNAKNLVRSWN